MYTIKRRKTITLLCVLMYNLESVTEMSIDPGINSRACN